MDKLSSLIRFALEELRNRLGPFHPDLVHLPQEVLCQASRSISSPVGESHLLSPIIPVMTSQPRPLSQHLRSLNINAKPITWPTVPKGKDRVRICLHAGNSRDDIVKLVDGIVEWARQSTHKESENPRIDASNGPVIEVSSRL